MGDGNDLIVYPGQWHRDAPDWILEEIKAERLIRGLAGLGGMMKDESEKKKAGFAETTLYLYTAAMSVPLEKDQVEIYKWCLATVYKRAKDDELPEMLEEKLEEGLTDWQEKQLDDLRKKIYHKRGGEIDHPVINAMKKVFLEKGSKKEPSEEGQRKMNDFFERF